MSNEDIQSFKDDMREDMMIEVKMRVDDDFFYDALLDKFEASMRELEIDIDNYCTMYDRGDQTDSWFGQLVENR